MLDIDSTGHVPGATRQLATFASELRYTRLPAAARTAARTAILNILAAALGGARTRIGALHLQLARDIGGGVAESTLIGDGRRVSRPLAAYANGNLAFALDYEDVCHAVIHAGPITVPAALAVAEAQRADGRALLTAVVAGYEVGTRIGLAMQPTAARGSQVWGQQYSPFAACAAAGNLLALRPVAMDVAMGVTGSYAPVPSAYKYFGVVAETRPMRETKLGWGWMSMAGVTGALSAKAGFRGGHGILDGPEGFWIMAGSDRCDFGAMTRNLGTEWLINDTRFKLHPSIAWNHPPYMALRRLLQAEKVCAADVARLRVWNVGVPRIADYQPAGAVDAQFSLPYAMATTLLGEPLTPALYDRKTIASRAVQELLLKIECIADPQMDHDWFTQQKMRSRVELQLHDGRVLTGAATFPDDRPDYGREDVIAKLHAMADGLLPESRVARIIDTVDALPKLRDVGMLMRLLTPARARAGVRAVRARPGARRARRVPRLR